MSAPLPPPRCGARADAALELVPLGADVRRSRRNASSAASGCASRVPRSSPEPGAYRVLDVLGESVLLVRNREGRLRAFYNVCRHRGSRLCREPRRPAAHRALGGGIGGGRITCPYHQWSYDLDGRLIAAPYLAGEPGFDKSLFSLYPVGWSAGAASCS